MKMLRRLWSRLTGVFTGHRREADLRDELQSHIDMQTDDNLRAGMSPSEARRQARVKFGNVELTKEEYRDRRGLPMLEALGRDVRYALRGLARSPGFTAVCVLTLALGIGANTAVFSVVHAVLLSPLPYEDPDRVVVVWATRPERAMEHHLLSHPLVQHWRAQARGKADLAAFRIRPMDIVEGGVPERLAGRMVSTEYFRVLGVSPAIGRGLAPEDALAGSNPVVMLSHHLWHDRFDSDPDIVGRLIELDGKPFGVAGVMPEDFQDLPRFPSLGVAETDFWLPISPDTDSLSRGSIWAYTGVARLADDTSLDEVAPLWDVGLRQMEQQDAKRLKGMGVNLVSLRESFTAPARPALLLLLGAVGIVLLIACANVAHLLLARASNRQAEIAVRASLGASRLRLMRQVATESLVLGSAGGLAGGLVAWLGLDGLLLVLPTALPPTAKVSLNGEVLIFTGALSLAAAFAFSLAPALRSSCADFRSILNEGSRGAGLSRGRIAFGRTLAVAEIAAALVLLIGGGLLIKSFLLLTRVETGFDPRKVLATSVSLPRARYAERARRVSFYQQVERRLRSLPGVEAAGVVNLLPLSGAAVGEVFAIEGRPTPEGEPQPQARWNQISPTYFETMNIRLMRGRPFTDQDIVQRAGVTIVNETMARRYWPDEDPLGKRVRFGPANVPWDVVVGVVADVKHLGLRDEAEPQAYVPYSDLPPPYATFVIRSETDAAEMAELVRREILAEDAAFPIVTVRTMEQVLAKKLSRPRSFALLLSVFAGVAVLMAAIGVYGIIHFSVSRRTHEMGIRRALGAQTADVLTLVLYDGLTVTVVGVSIGLTVGLGLSRLLESELYGIKATDGATYAVGALFLILVVAAACYVPARRATQVDPMTALRYE